VQWYYSFIQKLPPPPVCVLNWQGGSLVGGFGGLSGRQCIHSTTFDPQGTDNNGFKYFRPICMHVQHTPTLGETISVLERTYKTIDIRAFIAKEEENGEWLCIFLKIRLTDEDKKHVESIHKKRNTDLAIEEKGSRMLTQFESTIEEIRNGRITIQGINSQLRASTLANILETKMQRYPSYSKSDEALGCNTSYSKSDEASGYNHWLAFIRNDGSASTWKKLTDLKLPNEDLPVGHESMGDWFDIPTASWSNNIHNILIIMPIYIKRLEILHNEQTALIKYEISQELCRECQGQKTSIKGFSTRQKCRQYDKRVNTY
jgi:hypothetical protein